MKTCKMGTQGSMAVLKLMSQENLVKCQYDTLLGVEE